MVKAGHANPDQSDMKCVANGLLRNLKGSARHIYAKRVLRMDEERSNDRR